VVDLTHNKIRQSITRLFISAVAIVITSLGSAHAGEVYGKVTVENAGIRNERLVIQGAADKTGSITVRIDGNGSYQVFLKPGLYTAKIKFADGNESRPVTFRSFPARVLQHFTLLTIKMTTHKKLKTVGQLDPLKSLREWFDVGAKVAIALVGAWFAYLADDYQHRASVVTLLSQCETAESDLRSRMLQSLIGPFVGSTDKEGLKPELAAELLDLLQLNFHRNFELKPLLLRVDSQLSKKNLTEERHELRSIARRVADRQVAMLMAAGVENQNSWSDWFTSLVSKSRTGASDVDLYFSYKEQIDISELPPTLLASTLGFEHKPNKDSFDTATHPAIFYNASGQGVCSVSPNGAYSLLVHVTDFDAAKGTVKVSWTVARDSNACLKAAGGK
jgi:hypothetical protein